MDFLYKIDYKICSALSRVSRFHLFSFEAILMRYVRRLTKGLPIDYPQEADREHSDNNDIWVFWAQGEKGMPLLIQKCIESIKRHAKGNVNLISLETLNRYTRLPAFIYQKLQNGSISYTHFSDILRFALIRDYGGWWLDATIFLFDSLPEHHGLYTIKHSFNNACISGFRWATFFWHLPLHHPLASFVYDGLIRYWERNDFVIEYLLTDYLIKCFYDKSPAFQQEIDDLSENNPHLYFFQSASAAKSFDPTSWKKIRETTSVFKTSYKIGLENTPADSFCKHLLFE